MASRGFILFVNDDDASPWRLAPVSSDEPAVEVARSPEQIALSLRQAGYRGEGIVLALPSTWCVAATIDVANVPTRDYRSMTYRLEEHLPLAAESIVADFVVRGDRALAVCAKNDLLRATIVGLEAEGIAVQSISPAAMLAAQDLARADDGDQVLVLGESTRVSLIGLRGGVAASWVLLSTAPTDVALHLDVISLDYDRPLALRASDVAPDVRNVLSERGDVRDVPAGTVDEAARREARRVLEGRSHAWCEMRRGALAPADRIRRFRKALNAALASAAVLMLACSGGMLWRAQQYENAARANEAALTAEFQRAFPGWAVPTNVKTVIESERRRAVSLAEGGAGGGRNGSAVGALHNVLSQLPADERWTIRRMAFEDGSFEIEGKLRAADALDRFAGAVRRSGMTVATPESHKGPDGFWNFTLRGTTPAATASASKGLD
jgi:type II secretory pathway component PulL